MMRITIELPDDLLEAAQEFALLDSKVLIDLLQDEVDRRAMEMIIEEIQAYRAEKRTKAT